MLGNNQQHAEKTDTISVLLVKFTLIIIRTNEITRIRFSDYVGDMHACDEERLCSCIFSASPRRLFSVVVRVHFTVAHVHFMSEVIRVAFFVVSAASVLQCASSVRHSHRFNSLLCGATAPRRFALRLSTPFTVPRLRQQS